MAAMGPHRAGGWRITYTLYYPNGGHRVCAKYRRETQAAERLRQMAEELESMSRAILLTPTMAIRFVQHGLLTADELHTWLAIHDQFRQGQPTIAAKPRPQRGGWVYLIRSGRHYKIGWTAHLDRRLQALCQQMPAPVVLLAAIPSDDAPKLERLWHRRFAMRRMNGEWFALTAADVERFRQGV